MIKIKEKWREESGKKMRDDYKIYVALYNEAARLNNFTGNLPLKFL